MANSFSTGEAGSRVGLLGKLFGSRDEYYEGHKELFPDKINSVSVVDGDNGQLLVGTNQWVGSLVSVTNGDNPSLGNVAVGVGYDVAPNVAFGVHAGPYQGSFGVSFGVGADVSYGVTTGGNDVITGAGRGAEGDAGTGINVGFADEDTGLAVNATGIETGSATIIQPHSPDSNSPYGVAAGGSVDVVVQGGVTGTYGPNGVSVAGTVGAGVSGTHAVTVGNGSVTALSGAALEHISPIMPDPKPYAPREVSFDDKAGTQWLNGKSDHDVFVIDARSSSYGISETEDGRGVVVWSGNQFDILYGFEEIRFDDKSVDISDYGH